MSATMIYPTISVVGYEGSSKRKGPQGTKKDWTADYEWLEVG